MHTARRQLAVAATAGAVLVSLAGPAFGQGTAPVAGRGTAHSFIRAVDVHVGPTLRAAVVQSEAHTTLDAARAGVPENRVFRELVPALVSTPQGERRLHAQAIEASASNEGEAVHETAPVAVTLPGTASSSASSIRPEVDGLPVASLLGDAGDGWLVDAHLTPSRVHGNFRRGVGGGIRAALNVGSVSVLDGLVDLRDVGPGEIHGATSPDENSTGTRGLEVGRVRLLDVDALLRIAGLGAVADLPTDRLAGLSDRLDIAVRIGAQPLAGFASWKAATDAAVALQAELESAAVSGLGCLGLSPAAKSRVNAVRGAVGRPDLDCLSGVLLADLAADVRGIVSDMLATMRSGLEGSSLLELVDVGGNTEVAAGVTESGAPTGRALAWGRVGSVIVGGENLGGFATDTVDTALVALNQAIDQALSSITSELGDAYANLVTVDVLPVDAQHLRVKDNYVSTRASVALFLTRITPPGTVAQSAGTVLGDLQSAPVASAGVVDLSDAVPTAAVRSAAPVAGQAGGLEPVTLVIGSLDSKAEHTRPGVDLHCDGECTLAGICDGLTCRVTGGPLTTGASSSSGAQELPRTGGARTAAGLIAGAACLLVSHRLRRLGRRLHRLAAGD